MRQRPDAGELERLAEAILRDNPLPEDPKDRRYDQRMALKALSIAAHDREYGAADLVEEIDLFTALYGEEVTKASSHDDKALIGALNLVLVDQIRAGIWDEEPNALVVLLMAQVRARLARSNPKYLKATLDE
jgi:hypothetical protein